MTGSHPSPSQLHSSRPMPPPQPGRIIRVDARNRLQAVERLVATGSGIRGLNRARAERFVEFSTANAIRIDAMWAKLDEKGRITATVLAVPNPGRTAILFSSTPAGPDQVAALAELIAHCCGAMRKMDIHLAQVLLEPDDDLQRRGFLDGGFTMLAELSYMERPLPGRGRVPPAQWPDGVTVEPYRDALRADVLDVLAASYEETLDCPGLRGLRQTEDILDGHAGTGEYDPDLWTLLRIDGTPRGVLLLNRSPASNAIELVYVGLARAARGRGLGRELLRHGLHQVLDRAERAVTLAVDEHNDPAIFLYRGEGFRRVLRRVALICPLSRPEPGPESGPERSTQASPKA